MQNINQPQDAVPSMNIDRSDKRSSLVWGLILVAAGFFFLVQQTGIFGFLPDIFMPMIFAVASAGFFFVFLTRPRTNWWAAIPGSVLGGLAMASFIGRLDIAGVDALAGPLFLAAIGFGFALIFLTNPEQWWALIPGGVLMTLAVVAYLSEVDMGVNEGSVMFLGFGLTFAAIGALPARDGNRRWAFIPAAVLFAIGLISLLSMDVNAAYLWPLVLIAAGVVVLWRSLNRR